MKNNFLVLVGLIFLFCACSESKRLYADNDTQGDAGDDSDSDTDTDTDTDIDAGGDTDTTDTGTGADTGSDTDTGIDTGSDTDTDADTDTDTETDTSEPACHECIYFENFEADNGNFTIEGNATTWYARWEWGEPSAIGPKGPRPGSGLKLWATGLDNTYPDNADGSIVSPEIDLSNHIDDIMIVSWWQWFEGENTLDEFRMDISHDGGSNWEPAFQPFEYGSNDNYTSGIWERISVEIGRTYAVSNFKVRFNMQSDSSTSGPGLYIDDICIGVVDMPPSEFLYEFETGNDGFTASGSANWSRGAPSNVGPSNTISGTNLWGTTLDGNYSNDSNGDITSPVLDLSSFTGQNFALSWWHWYNGEDISGDNITVQATANGGSSWDNLYGPENAGNDDLVIGQWVKIISNLDPKFLVNNFQFRFHFKSDGSSVGPGWYVDNVEVGETIDYQSIPTCNP